MLQKAKWFFPMVTNESVSIGLNSTAITGSVEVYKRPNTSSSHFKTKVHSTVDSTSDACLTLDDFLFFLPVPQGDHVVSGLINNGQHRSTILIVRNGGI